MGLITAEEAASPKTEIQIESLKFSLLLQVDEMVYMNMYRFIRLYYK